MNKFKPKVIAIVGPTASGKSDLSVQVAKKFNGEVISADSRQVYIGLDIGTGKITSAEMQDVPHHLLDVVEPNTVYTGVDFKHDATAAISNIINRDHHPIIAGGTFFYIELLRGTMQAAPVGPNLRLRAKFEELSNQELLQKIAEKDPVRAEKIDPNNRRRLIRSLEIIEVLGSVPEVIQKDSDYNWLIIGIDMKKEILLDNFKKRIHHWLEIGFENEVQELINKGVTEKRFQELGFEYVLMIDFIKGNVTKEELIEKFIQKNWQYAKRQMTWLKRDESIEWFTAENSEGIFSCIDNFLQ